MSFKDMVERDARAVFLNLDEFGEKRKIWYDGVLYEGKDGQGVPVVLTGLKENDRKRLFSSGVSTGGRNVNADRAEGIYQRRAVLHAMISDLGGSLPEVGQRMRVSDAAGFPLDYYVLASVEDMGMARVELGGLDE